MLKLYKITADEQRYWETWENDDGSHTIHWGEIGSKGETSVVKPSLFRKPAAKIQADVDRLAAEGFAQIDMEDHRALLIEYLVKGHGDAADLDKRHRLEQRINETLGSAGLGVCDGGSIGSGTMEVRCYVVDYDAALRVIEADLKGTEFADFSRLYDEAGGEPRR